MWVRYNPNPCGRQVGDCAVRAVAKALDVDWDTSFDLLADKAKKMCDMPSSDAVWSAVLRDYGFARKSISNVCPDCYNAGDFCQDHPKGTYVLGFGGHTATIHNGRLYDSWNSINEIPQFYLFKKGD